MEAFGGDDTLSAVGNLAALTQLTIDAGPGADTSAAATAPTWSSAAAATTSSTATRATTPSSAGAGNDTMQWDPGDANDTLEGQDEPRHAAVQRLEHRREIELSANGAACG